MNGSSEPTPVDAELLGRLLDEYGAALALYAAQWTDGADDCVQETLVELAAQQVVPENLRAWLYRVVKNRALNSARSARRRRAREATAFAMRFGATEASPGFDQFETLALAEALEGLAEGDREIVVLRIWGALTFEEISQALSISLTTVYRRYQQALIRLRTLLESPCSTNSTRNGPNSK